MKLSNRHVKAMDRVGGANLILDWPTDLPLGVPVKPDHEREATAAEKAAALAIVRAECERCGLVPVHVRVVNIRRPDSRHMERAGQHEQHLAVLIIGRRWVHASARGIPPDVWPSDPPPKPPVNTTTRLAEIGQLLYGPDWVSPMARDLRGRDGQPLNLRTVQRWASGEVQRIPPDIWPQLAALLERREPELRHQAKRCAALVRELAA